MKYFFKMIICSLCLLAPAFGVPPKPKDVIAKSTITSCMEMSACLLYQTGMFQALASLQKKTNQTLTLDDYNMLLKQVKDLEQKLMDSFKDSASLGLDMKAAVALKAKRANQKSLFIKLKVLTNDFIVSTINKTESSSAGERDLAKKLERELPTLEREAIVLEKQSAELEQRSKKFFPGKPTIVKDATVLKDR